MLQTPADMSSIHIGGLLRCSELCCMSRFAKHLALQVNADEHRDLGGRFGVSGFPTLKWFGRGKPTDAPEE